MLVPVKYPAVRAQAAQLRQFAAGERRNDVHGVMRHIARQMTDEDCESIAAYDAQRGYPVIDHPQR